MRPAATHLPQKAASLRIQASVRPLQHSMAFLHMETCSLHCSKAAQPGLTPLEASPRVTPPPSAYRSSPSWACWRPQGSHLRCVVPGHRPGGGVRPPRGHRHGAAHLRPCRGPRAIDRRPGRRDVLHGLHGPPVRRRRRRVRLAVALQIQASAKDAKKRLGAKGQFVKSTRQGACAAAEPLDLPWRRCPPRLGLLPGCYR